MWLKELKCKYITNISFKSTSVSILSVDYYTQKLIVQTLWQTKVTYPCKITAMAKPFSQPMARRMRSLLFLNDDKSTKWVLLKASDLFPEPDKWKFKWLSFGCNKSKLGRYI